MVCAAMIYSKLHPLVSVVVTCYNYGRYLRECINSVLKQTYSNFEIIVIDDGSTDDTPQIIQSFLDNRLIKYFRQDNQGQATAKNEGIKRSRGDLIAFLDADDQWQPTKLEKQLYLFTSDQVGVVYSRASRINATGKPIPSPVDSKYLKPRRGMVTNYLIYDNFVPFSSSIVRSECFEKFGAFNDQLQMGIDWDRWLRISTKYTFEFCPEKLLIYRSGHGDQMSRNLEKRIFCADIIIESFLNDFPKAVSNRILKDSSYYTYCSRGYLFRKMNIIKSINYYNKAIRTYPLCLEAYVGLIKSLLFTFRRI